MILLLFVTALKRALPCKRQIASPDSDFAVQDLCFSPKRGDEAVFGLLGGEQGGLQQRQQQQRWETARYCWNALAVELLLLIKLGGAGDRFGDYLCGLRRFSLRMWMQSIYKQKKSPDLLSKF